MYTVASRRRVGGRGVGEINCHRNSRSRLGMDLVKRRDFQGKNEVLNSMYGKTSDGSVRTKV